jgi:uncharacterized phage-associated protein
MLTGGEPVLHNEGLTSASRRVGFRPEDAISMTRIGFVFKEEKAAEAAGHLLRLAGGRMKYLKLIKLLYLADRRCLIETGFTITGDRMVSMDHGPVLSEIYDRVKHDGGEGPWHQTEARQGYWARALKAPPDEGALSDYEIDVLEAVYREFGGWGQWHLVDWMHEHLPEWQDPAGSSAPIDPTTILEHEGQTPEQIAWRVDLAKSFLAIDRR